MTLKQLSDASVQAQVQTGLAARDDVAIVQALATQALLYPQQVGALGFARWAASLRRLKFWDAAQAVLAQASAQGHATMALAIEAAELANARKRPEQAAALWWDALAAGQAKVGPTTWLRAINSQIRVWRLDAAQSLLNLARAQHPSDQSLQKKELEWQAMSAVEAKIVLDIAGNCRITWYRQKNPASTVVVTFATLYSDLDTPVFGFPFVLMQGWDHVHVAQAAGSQYQLLSRDDFARWVGPLVRDRAVWTYGSSLGGYAAIYYADTLGARAIASSPSLPAHPLSTRFPRDKRPILHAPLEQFQTDARAYIFYDPEDAPDRLFIESLVLPACRNAIAIRLPYAGHQALRQLASADLLKPTLVQLIAHAPDSLVLDNARLESCPVYLEERAAAMARAGQWNDVLALTQRSVALAPSLKAYKLLLRAAGELGLGDQMEPHYTVAVRRYGLAKVRA
ncbi:MAG: hypothetical protein Fur007_12800 [Rhodoferax sp.]